MEAVSILVKAANEVNSTAAWLTIMNAIHYLRAGKYSNVRRRGISARICSGQTVILPHEVQA